MGYVVRPDGSIEAEKPGEALDLQAEIIARRARGIAAPAAAAARSTSNGAHVETPARGAAPETRRRPVRAEEARRQVQRASAFMGALERKGKLVSDDLAEALSVQRGKGLGSVMSQVKRTLSRVTGIDPDEIFHVERSQDRGVGIVVTKEARFGAAADRMKEASK